MLIHLIIAVIAVLMFFVSRRGSTLPVHFINAIGKSGSEFIVYDDENASAAVLILDKVQEMTSQLLRGIDVDKSTDAQLLVSRVDALPISFKELRPQPGEAVAMNTNKGELIELCLFDPTGNPVNVPALFAVVVHELAHMMDTHISAMVGGHSVHTDRFKRNEKFLMDLAVSMNLVPQGGSVGGAYCGIIIPDPEYAN
jgi:hypothetical protein